MTAGFDTEEGPAGLLIPKSGFAAKSLGFKTKPHFRINQLFERE